MKKIIVIGGCGRMGASVSREIFKNEEFELYGIIESPDSKYIGNDWGIIQVIGKTDIIIKSNLDDIIQNADQVMEFTNPETTIKHLKTVVEYKKMMIIGTTGFTKEEINMIKDLAKNIPLLLAPNLSPLASLFIKLAQEAATALESDYEIEIVEAHQRTKKDAPSGTAKKVALEIAKARNLDFEKVAKYGRKGITGDRSKDEIGIHSIRGGKIVGECTVYFIKEERLELTYRAHSVDSFAQGAIPALKILSNKKNGFYEMKDVIKI